MSEIKGFLGIEGVTGVRYLNRYDIENISDETAKSAAIRIFSEPQSDTCYFEHIPLEKDDTIIAWEYLPGQYDQRADSATQDSVSGGKATYTAPTGYSQYSWSLDGTQITSTSTSSNSYVSGTNSNVLTITLSSLANGSHDVYVEVKDSNGNYSSWSGQYTKN